MKELKSFLIQFTLLIIFFLFITPIGLVIKLYKKINNPYLLQHKSYRINIKKSFKEYNL